MSLLLKKELRPILFAAIAVGAAALGVLFWGKVQQSADLHFFLFALGCAYLAAIPFGLEFQQGTLDLLLTQPVPRSVQWIQKMAVIAAVVLGVALVSYATWPSKIITFEFTDRDLFTELMISMTLTASSACLCTLLARSIIGGAVFTLGGQMIIALGANLILAGLERWSGPDSQAVHLFNKFGMAVLVGSYCAVSLWLGWRTFQQLQVAEVMSASGATARARVFERLLPRFLQAVRGSLFLNLARKELSLHRPVLMLSLLFMMAWLAALVLRWAAPERVSGEFFVGIGFVLTVIAALLAGSLSMAEEKTLGTAEWHRTLPVSWKMQWSTKVGVAAFVTVLAGVVLPFTLTAVAVDFPDAGGKGVSAYEMVSSMLTAGLALLAVAIWASAMAANTVRAAALATIMTVVLILLFMLAGYVARETSPGQQLEQTLKTLLRLFSAQFSLSSGELQRIAQGPLWMPTTIGVVAMTALVQSFCFYRSPRQAWPGLIVIALLVAGAIGLWTGESLGWLNALGSLLTILLVCYLLRTRWSIRVDQARLPWFAAIVLAAVAFICWISLLTVLNVAAWSGR